MQNMLDIIDQAQNVDDRVIKGLEYPEDRTFKDVKLDSSIIGDKPASDEQYRQYMENFEIDNAMERARRENNEGTRKEVIMPQTFDIENSERILDDFENLDDLEREEVISNSSINKAVRDKLKNIELSNYQNQLRVDEITKTAMETNNILSYILWLLDTLNIDIETIGDLIQEYKNLIVVLRKVKNRKALVSDQGTDTDGLSELSNVEQGTDTEGLSELSNIEQGTDTDGLFMREQEELENYIQKYEILLSKYVDLVNIIKQHNISDLDLNLLQDILTRNKYSSQLILDNLNNSVDRIRDYSSEALPTTQGGPNQDLDGKFNEKILTSVYFIRKLADQLNISEAEINAKYPIVLSQGNNEIKLENERLNILATIEGLKLTSEILNNPDSPEYTTLVDNIGDSSTIELIQLVNKIITELNTIINSEPNASPMTGGSLNIKMGILYGGATYNENLKKLGRELVLNNLLSKSSDMSLEDRIKSFSMTTPKNNDFIKIKLRHNTLSKLLEISLKDFSYLLSKEYNESIDLIDKAINDNNDSILLDIWNSRNNNVNQFVEMSEKLSTYEFDTNDNLDKFLSKIKKNDSETELAKVCMSFILDLLKEKQDLKVLSKKANIDTVKYSIFVMKLSGNVRHFLLNKTKYKNLKSMDTINKIVNDQEIVDQYLDRTTLESEVERARAAVTDILKQVNMDQESGNKGTESVIDMITNKKVNPAQTFGRLPRQSELSKIIDNPAATPPSSPKLRIFGKSKKKSLRTAPNSQQVIDENELYKKLNETLTKFDTTTEEVRKLIVDTLSPEDHKRLDEEREIIMNDAGTSLEKSKAIIKDVIGPALKIKPAPERIKELTNKTDYNFDELSKQITTSMEESVDEIEDDMGFEGSTNIYNVSQMLLPPIDMAAVAPDGLNPIGTDTPPELSPLNDPSPDQIQPLVRPATPTTEDDEGVDDGSKTLLQMTNKPSGGKKHKTFKKKLRNQSKK